MVVEGICACKLKGACDDAHLLDALGNAQLASADGNLFDRFCHTVGASELDTARRSIRRT